MSTVDPFDVEYTFGHPQVYLTQIEAARLAIVKSRLGDNRQARLAVEWPPTEQTDEAQDDMDIREWWFARLESPSADAGSSS
jgi:hypothetical protein